ncbi:MAG: DUF493 domain-containing protein [Pseudomonadota bacterium]
MSETPETLIEFPTPFAVKIMGRNEPTFADHARGLVTQHTPGEAPLREESRVSKNERFLSVTVEITATSRDQLDAIYQTLTDDERVLMAL